MCYLKGGGPLTGRDTWDYLTVVWLYHIACPNLDENNHFAGHALIGPATQTKTYWQFGYSHHRRLRLSNGCSCQQWLLEVNRSVEMDLSKSEKNTINFGDYIITSFKVDWCILTAILEEARCSCLLSISWHALFMRALLWIVSFHKYEGNEHICHCIFLVTHFKNISCTCHFQTIS